MSSRGRLGREYRVGIPPAGKPEPRPVHHGKLIAFVRKPSSSPARLVAEVRVVEVRRPPDGTRSVAAARKRSTSPGSPVVATRELSAKERVAKNLPLLTILGALGLINLVGLSYYMSPVGLRVRSPLHPWLKSSGYVGQTAGLIALAFFIFIWLYPLRKKYRWMSFTGSMQRWLDLHVVAGLSLPLLVATHAGWQFRGMIGLGYVAMLLVCISGVVGKYLYTRIPRSKDGLELTIDQVSKERKQLLGRIASMTGLHPEDAGRDLAADLPPCTGLGPLRTVVRMLLDDLSRWNAARALRRRWKKLGTRRPPLDKAVLSKAIRLARRQMALSQKIRLLEAAHKVFRYWHVAHMPIAITTLVAVLLHVAIVVVLGVTWLR